MLIPLYQLLRRAPRRESAQVLVLFAFALVALSAIAALAVDGSIAYWQRTRMQMAADAATTAATWKMADAWDGTAFCRKSPCLAVADVNAAATALAAANGLEANQPPPQLHFLDASQNPLSPQPAPTSPVPSNAHAVRAVVAQSFKTHFAGAVGVGSLTARGSATGIFGVPSGLAVFPLAIGGDASSLPNNVTFSFQPPQSSGDCGSTCVNFEMLANLPIYPAPPPALFLTIGSSATSVGPPSEVGTAVSNATRTYVTSMIAADTSGSTCTNYAAPNPRIVYIPYVNPGFSAPPQNLTIQGFRAFMFTAAFSDRLEGCWVNVNAAAGLLDPSGTYTGVTMFKLVPTL